MPRIQRDRPTSKTFQNGFGFYPTNVSRINQVSCNHSSPVFHGNVKHHVGVNDGSKVILYFSWLFLYVQLVFFSECLSISRSLGLSSAACCVDSRAAREHAAFTDCWKYLSIRGGNPNVYPRINQIKLGLRSWFWLLQTICPYQSKWYFTALNSTQYYKHRSYKHRVVDFWWFDRFFVV